MMLLIILSLNDVVQLFNQGNRYYNENRYQEAINTYEQVLEICPQKDVYYNLGNAYFKTGKLGKAIIQYRKAYFLCPRDNDIVYNLNFLRGFRSDKNMIMPNPLVQLFSDIFHYFSMREAFVFAGIAFLATAMLISLYIIFRNKVFIWTAFVTTIFFIYSVTCYALWVGDKKSNWAVVIIPELKAYSGPGIDYKEILEIHDGAELKTCEERNGYYLIQLPGGIGGWVTKEGVEKIFP